MLFILVNIAVAIHIHIKVQFLFPYRLDFRLSHACRINQVIMKAKRISKWLRI